MVSDRGSWNGALGRAAGESENAAGEKAAADARNGRIVLDIYNIFIVLLITTSFGLPGVPLSAAVTKCDACPGVNFL